MKHENTTEVASLRDFTEPRINRAWLLFILSCATATCWLLFAKFVVPPIIESVYRGESLSLLNNAIRGQAEFPVEYYLQKWDGITMLVLWADLAFWTLAFATTSEFFFRKFVGEATPGTLGAIRMWTCAILLLSILWEDLGSIALLPLEIRVPMGLMKILDELPIGYQQFLTSELALRIFQWLTELVLFLGMAGWRTRLVVPAAAICAFVVNGILREYSGFWHQNLVPIYVLAVLSFTPCGDGWSVDRLWNIYRGHAVAKSETASARYGWARYACWVPIALTYAAAGLTKIRADGFDWVNATNMRNMLYEQTLLPRAGNWSISLQLAPAPDFVFVVLGSIALCGELFYVTVLFSRVARRILPAMQILMHIGIVFLQNILFFDLILLNLVFYDFTKLRKVLARWFSSRAGTLQVLYDGDCPMCCRTMRVLTCVDIFCRLEFNDFRRLDLIEYNRQHSLSLKPANLERQMYVISQGQVYGGFYAYRTMALALPALWPFVPLLFLPGISALGSAVYGYVARRRLLNLSCDATCETKISQAASPNVTSPVHSSRYRLVYGCAVAAVFVAMGFFWLRQIEYYPFTAVPMFTGRKTSTITYFKTLAHRESGKITPIQLEDTLGAWSINSRYEPLFDLCFGEPQEVDLCKRTLAILGSNYNKNRVSGEKLTGLEIQRWKWDFRADPDDPQYGHLDARFIGQVRPVQSR